MDVGFFEEDSAWKLITAYADLIAEPTAAYRQHPEPVKRVIAAYFDAIQTALGLATGTRWVSDQGRAFAGYAPVLGALGALLAQTDNFADLANLLNDSGASEAWGVIERVISAILEREQKKLCDRLGPQLSGALVAEAYSPPEQLTLLLQYVNSRPLRGAGTVKMAAPDQIKYQGMVDTYIPEHPFVRQREFRNVVLGSVVVAHGIMGTLGDTGNERVAAISRYPFLWRSLAAKLTHDTLIDGSYIGYALNSLWNDPLSDNTSLRIRSGADDFVNVAIPASGRQPMSLTTTLPMTLYGQLYNCDIDVAGDISLLGQATRGTASAFYANGSSSVICTNMDISSDSVRFDGNVWFEAENVSSVPRLNIYLAKDTKVGWGGAFSTAHPWNDCQATLPPPYLIRRDDVATAIIEELAQRTLSDVLFVLETEFTPSEDERTQKWIRRSYAVEFPKIIALMVEHRLASAETFHPAGRAKSRIRIHVDLSEVLVEMARPGGPQQWQQFIAAARAAM
jgi:hypothetical protein